jgi:hypothetical protein
MDDWTFTILLGNWLFWLVECTLLLDELVLLDIRIGRDEVEKILNGWEGGMLLTVIVRNGSMNATVGGRRFNIDRWENDWAFSGLFFNWGLLFWSQLHWTILSYFEGGHSKGHLKSALQWEEGVFWEQNFAKTLKQILSNWSAKMAQSAVSKFTKPVVLVQVSVLLFSFIEIQLMLCGCMPVCLSVKIRFIVAPSQLKSNECNCHNLGQPNTALGWYYYG